MPIETPVSLPQPEAARHRGQSLRTLRSEFSQAILDRTLVPAELPALYGAAVDEWLTGIFNAATRYKPRGCALIAVGGYGRCELYPGSDLDLVLMHHARRDYQRIAHETWYEIWDAGVRLDHSVRTRREALSVATADLKVILGLLDGRVVAGDARVADRLLVEIPSVWRRGAAALLRDFDHQVQSRHEQFGEVAFLLEPDLKQSAGGLRDLAALRALVVALPHLAPLVEQPSISEAERIIMSARVVVHCTTNSANDRLLLQEQDRVAEILALSDADELMAKIAEAGRTISSATTEAWRRARNELLGTTTTSSISCQLGRGVVLRGGEVALEPEADATDPALVIAIGRAAIEHNVPIDLESLDRLANEARAPNETWPATLRHDFISLLSAGPALIPIVEAIDQRHLFELLIPEWKAVRNRPQRNAYHRFTVDRHLLETVALCAEHLDAIGRPDLLIMGALLHDLGKGYPGDHSEGGSRIARAIGERMGFSSDDVTTLCALVAFHLVIPEFAIRRDLDDPSTALVVAKLVGNRQTLELLATLTEVDSKATGSAAWGPWKAELVEQLVTRVSSVLDGHAVVAEPPKPTPEQLELLAQATVALRANGRRVTVVAPDQPGLLAKVAGVLALNGCNVKRATASEGTPGMAIEVFQVEPAFELLPNWEHVERDLVGELDGSGTLQQRLQARDVTYSRARRPVSATPARMRVSIDNATSDLASIVEVQASDRLGLLHDIASGFAQQNVDVVSALIDTLGHEVIDTFYVRSQSGQKLAPHEIDSVKVVLESVISHAG